MCLLVCRHFLDLNICVQYIDIISLVSATAAAAAAAVVSAALLSQRGGGVGGGVADCCGSV